MPSPSPPESRLSPMSPSSSRFLLPFFLCAGLAFAQPTPTTSTVSLTVNKTTGAITGPVSAATFKSANSLGGDSLPSQTGNNGKFLTTNGTAASWATITGGGDLLSANNLADLVSATTALNNLAGVTTTAFGRGLLAETSASTLRTTLSLVPGTDVAPATSGTAILYGNGSGGFSSATIGGNLSFSAGTLNLSTTPNIGAATATSVAASGNVTTSAGIVAVGSTAAPRSSDPGFNLNRTLTGAGNSHGFSDQSEFGKDAGTAYAPFDARILVSGTANYDHFVSFQAAPTLSTSGTTTNLYGLYTLPGITAGTVTNSYGVYIANPSISGTGAITNSWGIYVPAPSGATNNYAAAFLGRVGIGTATPAFALDIAGSSPRINVADSGSGYAMLKLGNGAGSLYLAKEDATGGAILAGTAANSVVLAGDGAYPLYLGTNGAVRVRIDGSNGRVGLTGDRLGIGTATPSYTLDLQGSNQRINVADASTGYSLLKLSNSNGAVYVGKEDATGGSLLNGTAAHGVVVAGDGNNPLYLGTNGTIRLTIAGNGAITAASTLAASNLSGTNTGDQTITLSGDVSGSGTGAITTTLATVNSNVGTFGNATTVPSVTVNAQGLVTAVSNSTISIPATAISDSTSAGRTLLTAANAAAQKTALGLVSSDVGLGSVENTALSTWGGSTNIVTLGNVTTGTWSGSTVQPGKGGTGQTSYTNGQLLIGNTTSGGRDKATLTAGTGITVTNAAGAITIKAPFANVTEVTANVTLNATHTGKWIDCNHATTNITVTVNTGVFSADDEIYFRQKGAAKILFSGNATISKPTSRTAESNEQNSAVGLKSIDGSTFVLFGDLK